MGKRDERRALEHLERVCSSAPESEVLRGARVLILVEKGVEDCELFEPKKALKAAGARVFLAGPEVVKIAGKIRAGSEAGVYETKGGVKVKVDGSIRLFRPKNFDAVFIPGGWAPDKLRMCAKTTAFVREMCEQGKIVASICHGAWVLVSAGVLKGRTVTGYFSTRDDVQNAGGTFLPDAEVVVDRNIVTSRIPEDLPLFCKDVIARIALNRERGVVSDWRMVERVRRMGTEARSNVVSMRARRPQKPGKS